MNDGTKGQGALLGQARLLGPSAREGGAGPGHRGNWSWSLYFRYMSGRKVR